MGKCEVKDVEEDHSQPTPWYSWPCLFCLSVRGVRSLSEGSNDELTWHQQ
jgi:hypothetical protein